MSGWAITECGLGMCPDWTLLDENGDSVGFVYDMDHANLMAAAPDMLAALRVVMQHGRIDGSEERMNVVAAAIAKAEGRS